MRCVCVCVCVCIDGAVRSKHWLLVSLYLLVFYTINGSQEDLQSHQQVCEMLVCNYVALAVTNIDGVGFKLGDKVC